MAYSVYILSEVPYQLVCLSVYSGPSLFAHRNVIFIVEFIGKTKDLDKAIGWTNLDHGFLYMHLGDWISLKDFCHHFAKGNNFCR